MLQKLESSTALKSIENSPALPVDQSHSFVLRHSGENLIMAKGKQASGASQEPPWIWIGISVCLALVLAYKYTQENAERRRLQDAFNQGQF
jgi:hypothetical protein